MINASLAGVISAARASGQFPHVLGIRHGIEGLLNEELVPLHDIPPAALDRIARTPSAALGTGRFKLGDTDLDQCLDVMREHRIEAFAYIGGNDSADSANRLAVRAAERGQALRVTAVPKTIDNDLVETDHCPGYGSIARYLGNAVRDATWDSIASPQLYAVKFVEVMGRDAGWVAASGALGFSDAERDLEPVLLLPERPPAGVGTVLARIEADLNSRGWSVVVVPETLRAAGGAHFGGETPEYVDAFGHPYFASTGAALTRAVAQQLGVRARYEKPGTAARMSISLVSEVDRTEAYELGVVAVEHLARGESGFMPVLHRVSDTPYRCRIDTVPLERVANRVRRLPDEFITTDGHDVTSAFRAWAMPLLGPEPFPPYGRLDQERHGTAI